MEFLSDYGLYDWAVLILSLIGLGAFAGFLAGLLGIGGGVVLVPGLYAIFTLLGFQSDYLMHVAVGTSLAIIVPTGFSSARSHWKKGAVDMNLVRQIGIGIFIGVVIGMVVIGRLSSENLKMIFASAILILAMIMVFNPARFQIVDRVPGQPWSGLAGVVIGGISSLIGIGGATMSVPFMSLCKVPIHRAIGTASALGLVISIPATIGAVIVGWGQDVGLPLSLGFVSVPAWVCIIPVSVTVAPFGAWAAHKLPVKIMKHGFAVFMVLVSLKMWYGILQ